MLYRCAGGVCSGHTRALLFISNLAVVRFRFVSIHAFTCPADWTNSVAAGLQKDCALNDRRGLYSITSDLYFMRDAQHDTLGLEHAWDIARRIRVRTTPE